MANKIHNYLIERFTFGDDDFYDIDYFDGATYQTAKIKGSTIKTGIQAGLVSLNLYNNDDSLTANRTLDGASFGLTFTNLNQFLLKVTGLPAPLGTPAVDYQITPGGSGPLFRIYDSTAGVIIFQVSQTGAITFNEAYTFPTVDGLTNQFLQTDGAGALTWADPTATLPGIVLVEVAGDLPATLIANTIYLIVGTVITSASITTAQNSVLIGWDSSQSILTYIGTGTFLTIADDSFSARNLTLSTPTGTLFEATNIDYTIDPVVDPFQGRNQRFTIVNCVIKGAGFNTPTANSSIGSIEGFSTINFNANLITGFNAGLEVSNGLSFEALNNKSVLWGQSVGCNMISFRRNNWSGQTGGVGSYIPTGFNVLNFNGSTLHPRTNETGIFWDSTLATTQLGNISGNVLITTGGGTTLTGATYDDIKEINVQGNQGLADNTPYILVTLNGPGASMTMPATSIPIDCNAQATATNSQLMISTNEARVRYTGIKDIYGEIVATLSIDKGGGGTDTYTFELWEDNGGGFVQLPNASYILGSDSQGNNFTITYSTTIRTLFEYEIRVTSASVDPVQVVQMQFSIKG